MASKKPIRRKADGERREVPIKVLVTPDEKDVLQSAADAAAMSVSTWLRHIALKAAKTSA